MKTTPFLRAPRVVLQAALAAMAGATMLLAGCATGPNANPADPIEPFNREVFRINEDFDKGVLKPVAQKYVDVVPSPARTAVSNFFSNAGDVYSAVNNLLQLKGTAALEDTMRVAINTVLGLGGLIDIASDAGLSKHKEDFGQTLGVWGVPAGPYIVWPLLGPSTVRDTAGFLVDWQMDPLTYFDSTATYSLAVLRVVDVRASLLGASNVLEQGAVDKYTFLRDAYLQRRRYLIYDGNLPEDSDGAKPEDVEGGSGTVAPSRRFTPNWPNWPIFRR
ncbi:Intermembrane phospholipid transport system lipoprotein MlaA [Ralstonia condita]|uniref:Intermembrane phospholipid transport system lipoprotein MlaA n=1 Tax=Ralstonia condita TaxID=3058600 RepID=A0ABN9J4E8_9RALS|nr:VacJ family lipoprotein [Ralstonia sp. LMG 7141]CAJ0799400.1 Intermembrane phospholipid transport system lipoprotein MlaA [Ralstonia sp. LMG 7141]